MARSHPIAWLEGNDELGCVRESCIASPDRWQELRDYDVMDDVDKLLRLSARRGGCGDFGKAITHTHYHPVSGAA